MFSDVFFGLTSGGSLYFLRLFQQNIMFAVSERGFAAEARHGHVLCFSCDLQKIFNQAKPTNRGHVTSP